MNLEQSLRDLAREDASAQVPARVDTAVMAAWDALEERCEDDGAALRGRGRMVWAIGAVAAAGLMAIVLWPGAGSAPRNPAYEIGDDVRDTGTYVGRVPRSGPADTGTHVGRVPGSGPTGPGTYVGLVPRSGPAAPAPSIDAGYVLVPESAGGGPPLTLMRVRMPRSAFARLVPIANPDGDGMVDVEVLVGEDGVARSIRRAAAVGWADAN